MRKWIALFTIILTYYIAGMFHSRILLTAALMEGFLFILMFVLSGYLSARFSVHAGSGECHTSKNSEAVSRNLPKDSTVLLCVRKSVQKISASVLECIFIKFLEEGSA